MSHPICAHKKYHFMCSLCISMLFERKKKCYVQNASDELLAQLVLLKSNAIPLHRQVGKVRILAEGTLTLV